MPKWDEYLKDDGYKTFEKIHHKKEKTFKQAEYDRQDKRKKRRKKNNGSEKEIPR